MLHGRFYIINILRFCLRNVKFFLLNFFIFRLLNKQTQSVVLVMRLQINPEPHLLFLPIFKTNDSTQLVYLVHLADLANIQHRHQHSIMTRMGMIMRPLIKQHDDDDDDSIIHWTDLIAFPAVWNYTNPSTCCCSSLNRPIACLQEWEKKHVESNFFFHISSPPPPHQSVCMSRTGRDK